MQNSLNIGQLNDYDEDLEPDKSAYSWSDT